MFIRSERLFLRPGWPEDWREIMAQIADELVVRNLEAVPWPVTDRSVQGFVEIMQDQPRCPHFLITLPGSDGAAVVGCIGLKRGEEGVELGYWIGRDHWNRGFATEAARAVLRLAATLGHRTVRAGHFLDNQASGRVLAKLGFRATGEVRSVFSHGRGETAPAATLALDLAAPWAEPCAEPCVERWNCDAMEGGKLAA
jgi:RimJ/RimL family protein N-acetyltransferase